MSDSSGNKKFKPATRIDVIEALFPPEKRQDVIESGPPSGRPVQMGPYAWKESDLLNQRDLDYLSPKRTVTIVMDEILACNDPFRAIDGIEFDKSPESLRRMLISLDSYRLQPLLFVGATRLDLVDEIDRLLNHDRENIREVMTNVLGSLYTFIEWLKTPGYDFVFGSVVIPNAQIELDDGRKGILTGGRADALGIKFMNGSEAKKSIAALSQLNARRRLQGHPKDIGELLETAEKIVKREDNLRLERTDILEFKLSDLKTYPQLRQKANTDQVKRYLGVSSSLLGFPLTGAKLIYFGQEGIDEAFHEPEEYMGKAKEIIKDSERVSRVKAAARENDGYFRELLYIVRNRKEGMLNSLMGNLFYSESIDLAHLTALTHYEGACRLDDGSWIFIGPYDHVFHIYSSDDAGRVSSYKQKGRVELVDGMSFSALEKQLEKEKDFELIANEGNKISVGMNLVCGAIEKFGRRV